MMLGDPDLQRFKVSEEDATLFAPLTSASNTDASDLARFRPSGQGGSWDSILLTSNTRCNISIVQFLLLFSLCFFVQLEKMKETKETERKKEEQLEKTQKIQKTKIFVFGAFWKKLRMTTYFLNFLRFFSFQPSVGKTNQQLFTKLRQEYFQQK